LTWQSPYLLTWLGLYLRLERDRQR